MTTPLTGVRHVIFDFGGTLADPVFPFTVFRRFSPTKSVGTGEVHPPHWLQRQVRKVGYPIAARLFKPYPHLTEVLTTLRSRGYQLHVLSNNSSILPMQLEVLGITDFFDGIAWSEEIGIEKPDPRIFEVMLERVGASAEESVYVGDSYGADVLGATGAGIRVIHADYRRKGPDHSHPRFHKIEELLELLPAAAPS